MLRSRWLPTALRRCRGMSSSAEHRAKSIEFKEIRIPVCHGHLAAKVWGDAENSHPQRRILALHGWQDNANSFDPLILDEELGLHRFIKDGLCVTSIDFSGHGLSSHLPPGSIYSHHTYVIDILTTANFLKWNEFSLLGHSMGGGMGFYAAFLYPERVNKLVGMDATFPFWLPDHSFEMSIESAHLFFEKFSSKYLSRTLPPPKEYTLEEYLEAARRFASLMYPESPDGSTTTESSLLLLQRGSKPTSDGKFVLNGDLNMRAFFPEMSSSARLPLFLERFEKKTGMLFMKPDRGVKVFKETLDLIAEHGPAHLKSLEIAVVPNATHHVHMNEPKKVLPKLIDFLIETT